jgi:carboxyl-terminal processing protease
VNKFLKYTLITFVAIVILAGAFSGGVVTGYFVSNSTVGAAAAAPLPDATSAPADPALPPNHPAIDTPSAGTQSTPEELQTIFAPFWEAWDIIHQRYVKPVDNVTLMQGAIRGMLDTLDTGRNYYYNAQEAEQNDKMLNRPDYTGIGAWVSVDKDYLTVISPIKGSPAEAAGLMPNDQIIAIDGEDMTGVDPEMARQKVLGPAGTDVKLTIYRAGEDPFEVTITRAVIDIKLVESKMLDNNIGYVALTSFGETADEELRAAIDDLKSQNAKALIFDLRNNGGGYLDQAILISSEFLPADQIVLYEEYGDGTRQTHKSVSGGTALDIPMVMLVNAGSASASEIVAGALQDLGRAKLVGTVTFGKGSVQSLIPLSNDQGIVGITVATWLTPKERLIQGLGLTPDYVIELTREDMDANRDPQLDKAIELLSQP